MGRAAASSIRRRSGLSLTISVSYTHLHHRFSFAPATFRFKLNQQVFEPGDRILFKSGTEYVGQFEPKGSGSEGKPVMVDKYGDGGKPILHGDGQKQHTILLEGLEYWELNNLEAVSYTHLSPIWRTDIRMHWQ